MGGESRSSEPGTARAESDSGRTRFPAEAPAVPAIAGGTLRSHAHAGIAAEAVLDKLNRGVVIFDGEARVLFVNASAWRVLRETSALAISDGRLHFSDTAAQAKFDAFLLRSDGLADGGGQVAVVMRVDADAGRAPLRALVSALTVPAGVVAGRGARQHVLMIYEPHAGRHVPKRILQELYGLSDAEADLVAYLFEGESLETAAGRLHISLNTAKTHLQHVFRKCDVHSQGELLQLLSLGPRTL